MRYEEKLLILITNYRLGSWLLVQKSVVSCLLSVICCLLSVVCCLEFQFNNYYSGSF